MTATAAPKAPSVWKDFIDIFTSPGEVFACRQNGMKLPRFSGHLQRLDRDSRQEVWHEEARTEGV